MDYNGYWNTEAEARLSWMLLCIHKNGWEARVPPFPADVTPKREQTLATRGLALDDPPPSPRKRREDVDETRHIP